MTSALILGLIKKVVKAIDNGSNEEEKRIAHELVDGLFPQEEKLVCVFYQKKNTTYFKYSNLKEYSVECKEKKNDKYIGCSIVEGYFEYGSKTRYNKHLKEFYGCDAKDIEKYSLIDAYARFGGKEKFEKYVDGAFRPKATQDAPKTKTE